MGRKRPVRALELVAEAERQAKERQAELARKGVGL
jgi:hypothetical protein